MGRESRRPAGLRPNGSPAASSLLNGSYCLTRFVPLPCVRPVWTQRRCYEWSGYALTRLRRRRELAAKKHKRHKKADGSSSTCFTLPDRPLDAAL